MQGRCDYDDYLALVEGMPPEELAVLERMQDEIAKDIDAGRVPCSVRSFAELHDYVDANEYGGACEGEFDPSDEAAAFWNRLQDTADVWLRAKRPN